MSDWGHWANEAAGVWAAGVVRASWQGGIALAAVWAGGRLLPGVPAAAKCWAWRVAYLKLLVALVWATPLDLPVLPKGPPAPAGAADRPGAAGVAAAGG